MRYQEKCLEIFLNNATQMSEQGFRFFEKYINSAMLNNEPENEFLFVVGMGGDQIPPPILETYVIQPLRTLNQLHVLKAESKINYIPKLVFVFSYTSQMIENDKDKAGNEIRPSVHTYNSRVCMERIRDFVIQFFPNLLNYCLFLEFPPYDRYSLARLYFATLWLYLSEAIPDGKKVLDTLFAIKGDVLDSQRQERDLFQSYLGGFNAYPPRHLFTNLMVSPAHTLRFGVVIFAG